MSLRALLVNSAWNLMGNALPLLVALLSIPPLAAQLGEVRLGILTIFWIVVGYFSLFDLGIGRAIARLVASSDMSLDRENRGSAICTGLFLVFLLGLLASALLIGLAAIGYEFLPGVETDLHGDLNAAIAWIAAALPLVSLSTALRGILEGEQRFLALNLIRAPMGSLLFLAPLLAIRYGEVTLEAAALGLLLARLAGLLALALSCRAWLASGYMRLSTQWIAPLLSFGGWLTVSGIVGPLIVYLDRFLLTQFVTPGELSYYTIPAEIGLRVLALPAAIGVALFPAVAALTHQVEKRNRLTQDAFHTTVVIMLVVLGGGVFLCKPLLDSWMGPEMAAKGGAVLLLLAAGAYANSVAQVTYNSLLGIGLSRTTATVHFFELIAYVPAMIFAAGTFGIMGAAACWSLRAMVDALIMTRLWEVRSATTPQAGTGGSISLIAGTGFVGLMAMIAWQMSRN